MANRFAVYDAIGVSLIIADIPITDGLPQDGFLSIAPQGAIFGAVQDLGGLVTRYRMHNRLMDVELNLRSTSIHHAQLSALHAADSLATNGAGVGSFLLKDSNSTTLIAGAQCWVAQAPEIEFAAEPGIWTWQFVLVCDAHTYLL